MTQILNLYLATRKCSLLGGRGGHGAVKSWALIRKAICFQGASQNMCRATQGGKTLKCCFSSVTGEGKDKATCTVSGYSSLYYLS